MTPYFKAKFKGIILFMQYFKFIFVLIYEDSILFLKLLLSIKNSLKTILFLKLQLCIENSLKTI